MRTLTKHNPAHHSVSQPSLPSFTTGEPRENIIPELLRPKRRHHRHVPRQSEPRAGRTRRVKPPWRVPPPYGGWRWQRPVVTCAYPRGRHGYHPIAERRDLRRRAFRFLVVLGVPYPHAGPVEERGLSGFYSRNAQLVAGVLGGGVNVGGIFAAGFVAIEGLHER